MLASTARSQVVAEEGEAKRKAQGVERKAVDQGGGYTGSSFESDGEGG
jgi:hypothetical protein